MNVADLLWSTTGENPRAEAIVVRGATVDYEHLRRRAAALGEALMGAGVESGRGERVGIFLDGGVDAVAAFFAVAAIGATAVVINESLRSRQIEHMLEHAGATALISSRDILNRLPRALETPVRTLYVEDVPAQGDMRPCDRGAGDPAQICYTSGSTGTPKGVVITHGNLLAVTDAVIGYLGISRTDRIASFLPFSFVYGWNQALCAVGSGATLVIERSPLPQQLVRTARESRVTVLAAVPPLWQQLLRVERFRSEALPDLRIVTNAGGHLPEQTVCELRAAQPRAALFLMYGLTEVLRSTYLPPEELSRRPGSMGKAIPGSQVFVLNESLELCRPGEVGELVHGGPTVTAGYWNDAEATAQVYRPHPFRPEQGRVVFSGDLVRTDAEGFLYFVGRRDRMIKTLGYRVSPEEVAGALIASGEVAEAIVAGEPDQERGQRIVAFVILIAGGSLERLRQFCAVELPRHMQPARFEVRESLPRLANGKHDVRALVAELA
jgi:amino acid adenylation domain-containing protein